MRLLTALAAATLAASAALLPVGPALAGDGPSGSACPSTNFELLIVDDLTAQGYMVPALVDESGNNNGLVCGDPFTRWQQRLFCFKFGPCTVPIIYNFTDDIIFPR
ncbi:MAG: hypothetical protein H0V10_14190 [Geodermatophilaceae bacterium]|nr:hypothetical protein [Geodermatophilaceae bacterium]